MNSLKNDFKKIASIRRRIYSELDLNKIYQENEERKGFKKSKAKVDKLYKAWKSLQEDLKGLVEAEENLISKAEAEGLTSKEIMRLSLEALDELNLEAKQG